MCAMLFLHIFGLLKSNPCKLMCTSAQKHIRAFALVFRILEDNDEPEDDENVHGERNEGGAQCAQQ